MKKKLLLLVSILIVYGKVSAQQRIYEDFEKNRHVRYAAVLGVLDTSVATPDTNSVNHSKKCGLYIPKTDVLYTDIRMITDSGFNIRPYLTGVVKFTLQIMTNDTAARQVRIQVGRRQGSNDLADTSYIQSVYAEFEAFTSRNHKNTWEQLSFSYVYTNPKFDTVANPINDLNKILLFYSYQDSLSHTLHDSVYFDNLMGPVFTGLAAVNELKSPNVQSLNMYPNPASNQLNVNFSLSSPASVSLSVTDLTGRVVKVLPSQRAEGMFSASVPTEGLQAGMYYLRIETGETAQTQKFIVQ